MGTIRIDLSKELHKELKMMALQDDTTLQKLIPVLISAGIAHHKHDAQEAKIDTEKPRRIHRTDGKKRTNSTKSLVLAETSSPPAS